MLNKFWEITCKPMVWFFAIVELALCLFLFIKFSKKKDLLTFLVGCITFGLFYDALMIALGSFVDPTKVLVLQELRYYFHVLLIPLLLIIVARLLKFNKFFTILFIVIAVVLMGVGVFATTQSELSAATVGGVSRMEVNKELTPMWVTIFTIMISVIPVIPLIIAGIIIFIKEKTPFVFLAGLLMFIFAAAIQGDYAFYATMYGELFMVGFLTLYILKTKEN